MISGSSGFVKLLKLLIYPDSQILYIYSIYNIMCLYIKHIIYIYSRCKTHLDVAIVAI